MERNIENIEGKQYKYNNEQQRLYCEEINKRDDLITSLERNLKKLGLESIDKFNIMSRQLHDLDNECSKLKLEVDKKTEEAKQTTQTLNISQTKLENCERDLTRKIEDLQIKLTTTEKERDRVTKENNQMYSQLSSAAKTIQTYKSEVNRCHQTDRINLETKMQIQNQLQQLQANYARQVADNKELVETIAKYRQDTANFVETKEKLTHDLNNTKMVLQRLSDKFDIVNALNKELEHFVSKYKQDLVILKESKEKLSEELNSTKTMLQRLQDRFERVQDSNKELEEMVSKYRQESIELTHDKERMKFEMEDMKKDAINNTTQEMRNYMRKIVGNKDREIRKLQDIVVELKTELDKK